MGDFRRSGQKFQRDADREENSLFISYRIKIYKIIRYIVESTVDKAFIMWYYYTVQKMLNKK